MSYELQACCQLCSHGTIWCSLLGFSVPWWTSRAFLSEKNTTCTYAPQVTTKHKKVWQKKNNHVNLTGPLLMWKKSSYKLLGKTQLRVESFSFPIFIWNQLHIILHWLYLRRSYVSSGATVSTSWHWCDKQTCKDMLNFVSKDFRPKDFRKLPFCLKKKSVLFLKTISKECNKNSKQYFNMEECLLCCFKHNGFFL